MYIGRFLNGQIKTRLARAQLCWTLKRMADLPSLPYVRNSWSKSLENPTSYYLNCVRHFHQFAPERIREHRRYFSQKKRGFGESAFHIMWDALCQVDRPTSFLEIGVYRGQVISLISLVAKSLSLDCFVCGVSPFTSAADSVSKYSSGVDYWQDTLENFKAFNLPSPFLIQGMSTEPGVVEEFSSRRWDLIYIDGNHDYEIAKGDFLNCSKILNPGGKIVLDDSALYTAYRPPLYATAGHPGPSRLAMEIPSLGFQEVLRVGHNRVFLKTP